MDTVDEELSKDNLTSREVSRNLDLTSEFSFIGARSNKKPVNFRLLAKHNLRIGSVESSVADETIESQIDAADVLPRFATSAHSSYNPINMQVHKICQSYEGEEHKYSGGGQ